MTDQVWVLLIDHGHGTDTHVCKTEEIAQNRLIAFVKQWWSYEFEDDGDPECPDVIDGDALETYFARAREYYSIRLEHVIEE